MGLKSAEYDADLDSVKKKLQKVTWTKLEGRQLLYTEKKNSFGFFTFYVLMYFFGWNFCASFIGSHCKYSRVTHTMFIVHLLNKCETIIECIPCR